MSRATEDHVVKPKKAALCRARRSRKFLLNVQNTIWRGQMARRLREPRLVTCWRRATSKRDGLRG